MVDFKSEFSGKNDMHLDREIDTDRELDLDTGIDLSKEIGKEIESWIITSMSSNLVSY
jgi:hypothetical protein